MYPINTTYRCDDRLQVASVSWERIFLNVTIKSEYDGPLEFALSRVIFPKQIVNFEDDDYQGYNPNVKVDLVASVKIEPDTSEGNTYTFRLNMSTLDGKNFLNNGRWAFTANAAGIEDLIICSCTYEVAYLRPELDRIFPYGKGRYSYTVHFSGRCLDSVHIMLALESRFMIENFSWKDRYVTRERRTHIGRIRCVVKKFKIWLMNLVYHIIAKTTPKNGTRILFMSETKPYLWGNLKYISERLQERDLDKKYHLSYTFRIAVGKNNNIFSWFHTIRMIAKQDIIFVDDFAPIFNFLEVVPETTLVQVWHAGEGFKAVGYGRFGKGSSPFPTYSCHRKYDYAITGSRRLVKVYSEVFGQPESCILPLGMARLDGYLDPDIMQEKIDAFYADHPECQGKKLILFSPTFRGSGQRTAHYQYAMLDMKRIYEFCGDEYIWAFKMHPFIRMKPPIPEEYSDRLIDLGDYHNINDLYYVTDIMITDYSSAYFEYSMLRRPVLFYTYDREIYELTRGVHKSILEEAPGKVCDTFDDLMTALSTGDFEIEKTIKFAEENFGEYDGHAADKIIDTIILGKGIQQ